jgi:polygalacturonase
VSIYFLIECVFFFHNKALTSAWNEACASTTAAKIVIPAGTYQLNGIELKGPCKAPIELQVDGTIQAPADPSVIKGTEQWFKFLYMDHLTLSGKGVFDGQGATVYKKAAPAAAWSGKNSNSKVFMVNNLLDHHFDYIWTNNCSYLIFK